MLEVLSAEYVRGYRIRIEFSSGEGGSRPDYGTLPFPIDEEPLAPNPPIGIGPPWDPGSIMGGYCAELRQEMAQLRTYLRELATLDDMLRRGEVEAVWLEFAGIAANSVALVAAVGIGGLGAYQAYTHVVTAQRALAASQAALRAAQAGCVGWTVGGGCSAQVQQAQQAVQLNQQLLLQAQESYRVAALGVGLGVLGVIQVVVDIGAMIDAGEVPTVAQLQHDILVIQRLAIQLHSERNRRYESCCK